MKKILISAATGIVLLLAYSKGHGSCCDRRNNFYVEIFGGPNFLQAANVDEVKHHFKTGYVVSGSIGYRFSGGVRLEAEYAYRSNQSDKTKFHRHFASSSYMANLLWDIPFRELECFRWVVEPFVGAGIGYDSQKFHREDIDAVFKKNKHPAWQVIAGLNYPFFCHFEMSLEYKLHSRGSRPYDQAIGLGLKYIFY